MILGNSLNKPGYSLQNFPTAFFANSYKSGIFVTQFSLRMRIISTSHKHYNNFGRIYIGDVLKFTQLVRRNICGAARNTKLKNVDE
jgi:hypothetical protein